MMKASVFKIHYACYVEHGLERALWTGEAVVWFELDGSRSEEKKGRFNTCGQNRLWIGHEGRGSVENGCLFSGLGN